jgi:hypothetical protein
MRALFRWTGAGLGWALAALVARLGRALRMGWLLLPPVLAAWLVFTQGWWMRALPGEDIASLEVMHPDFLPAVDAVVAELEAAGWQVRVSSGWRSPERQDAIYHLGQLGVRLGASPWTSLRGGMSCHNQLQDDGSPGAAAVDLSPGGVEQLEQRAAFYQALGQAASRRGLRWGGSFRRSNPVWARYGMGWDPAHIEDRGLCQRLRAGGES